MFLPLAFGGCMVIGGKSARTEVRTDAGKVRFVNTGPSLLDACSIVDGLPHGVTTAVVAGEKLSRQFASSLFDSNARNPTAQLLWSN